MALVCSLRFPMDCDACYETIIIEPCADTTINFQVGLPAGQQRYLFVIDKFKNVWRNLITVKPDGSIDLTLTDYPDGLFNKYSGFFRVFLSTDDQGQNIVDLTINGNLYLCIIFGFCYATFP